MTTTVICPNCGYKQGPTAKCRMCSTLFDYHYAGPPAAQAHDSERDDEAAKPPAGILRRIFRLLTGAPVRPS